MAKENFSELSTEDLIKKKKTMTFATGLLAGVLIALFIITIFQTINEGFTPLVAVPFAFLPILIMCYSHVNAMDKDLKVENQTYDLNQISLVVFMDNLQQLLTAI